MKQHDNTKEDYRKARRLRNEASFIERKLWCMLREVAKAEGVKFRRQHVVHPYVTDFACLAVRLVVEVDGDSHEGAFIYDKKREDFLEQEGYSVLRFSNAQVLENTAGVVDSILEQVKRLECERD